MAKQITGVLVGLLIFGISSMLLFKYTKVDPSQPTSLDFIIVSGAIGGVAALLSGYFAAYIIKQKQYLPILILACIVMFMALVSIVLQPKTAYWSEFLTIFLFTPLIILGGHTRFRQQIKVDAVKQNNISSKPKKKNKK